LAKNERSEAKNLIQKNKKNPKATFRHRASLQLRRQSGGQAHFDHDAALRRQAVILDIMADYLPSKIFNFDESKIF
jgi:hypothetical protein